VKSLILIALLTLIPTSHACAKSCADITAELRRIAWNDPDGFDFTRLKEEGAFNYMCLKPNGQLDIKSPWGQLCLEAQKRGCK